MDIFNSSSKIVKFKSNFGRSFIIGKDKVLEKILNQCLKENTTEIHILSKKNQVLLLILFKNIITSLMAFLDGMKEFIKQIFKFTSKLVLQKNKISFFELVVMCFKKIIFEGEKEDNIFNFVKIKILLVDIAPRLVPTNILFTPNTKAISESYGGTIYYIDEIYYGTNTLLNFFFIRDILIRN